MSIPDNEPTIEQIKVYIRTKLNWEITKLLAEMAQVRMDFGGVIDEEGQLVVIMERNKLVMPSCKRTVPPLYRENMTNPSAPVPAPQSNTMVVGPPKTFDDKVKWMIDNLHLTKADIDKQIEKEIKEFNGLIDNEGALTVIVKKVGIDFVTVPGDKPKPTPAKTNPLPVKASAPAKKTSAPAKKSEPAKPSVPTPPKTEVVAGHTVTTETKVIEEVPVTKITVKPVEAPKTEPKKEEPKKEEPKKEEPTKDVTKLVGKVPPVKKVYNPKTDLFGAQITLVSGIPGDGKTWMLLHHPLKADTFYFDLEDKYAEILKWNPDLIRKEQYTNARVYSEDKITVDKVATYDALIPAFKAKIAEKNPDGSPKWKHFVLDGIGDIRRMAEDKYIVEHHVKAVYGQGPWGEVNENTKEVIYAVINYARVTHTTATFTCWLVDDYDKVKNDKGEIESVKNGKKVFDSSVKEYILGFIDEFITLKRVNEKFWARRIKSPRGMTEWMEWTLQ